MIINSKNTWKKMSFHVSLELEVIVECDEDESAIDG